MSTYLASSEPKHKSGTFTAFTATAKYPTQRFNLLDHALRVTINGDPFFPNLRTLRMAINRLSSQTYPYSFNTTTNTIESGRRHTKDPNLRALTADDFIIEAHRYTPQTILVDHTSHPSKTTPDQIFGTSP